MKILRRSMITVIRQPIKFSLFLSIVVLLSALTAGSIIVHQAIGSTDQQLRNQMPAVVTVGLDSVRILEETGEFPHFASVPPSVVRYLGQSEYVRLYDYAFDIRWGVTAYGLTSWQDDNFPGGFGGDYNEHLGLNLRVEGVNHLDFLEVRSSFLELVEGRGFEADELANSNAVTPVIISQGLADANNFSIGTEFSAQVVMFEQIDLGSVMIDNLDVPPLTDENFPLVVIGIFEPIFSNHPEEMDMQDTFQTNRWQAIMQNRIFVPGHLAEEMYEARSVVDAPGNENIWIQNFFWLEDPDYFDDFSKLVADLEGEWIVNDFSSGFRSISFAMEQLREIANGILIGAMIMTTTVIVLVVQLMLKERKREIGIYLALGEARKRIACQMLMELLPLVLIGMTLALFVGLAVSNTLSNTMLMNHLAEHGNRFLELDVGTSLEWFGYRFELNQAEMIEAFNISLGTTTILIFYGIGLITTVISTIIPVSYTVKNAPLKLLTE